MATNVPASIKCSECSKYFIIPQDIPEDTSKNYTFLKSNINPEGILTKCNECINKHTINIRLNRYNRKPSTDSIRPKNRINIPYQNSKFLPINKWIITIIVLLLAILSFFIIPLFTNSNDLAITVTTLKSTLERLNNTFPSLNKSFLKKVNGGLLRLKKPGEPFVFLLLHDDSNKKATDCLASYTSSIAKKNIFTKTMKSLWMNASEWVPYSSSSDLDLLHKKLMKPLEENEVLILENLQDLPWSLANCLHYLCDTVNPKFVQAMYLLELKVNVDRIEELNDAEKVVIAEEAMDKAWLEAPRSFRAALITRLTSYVDTVLLKSDDECPNNAIQPLQSDRQFINISP